MSLLVPWLVFPLVATALSLGCGFLVERAAGLVLPGALLPPLGLAVLIVGADLVTMSSATAQLAAPGAIVLAIVGYGLAGRSRWRPDWWAAACALGVFAVYAAPIVLSGQATFAGYITLDDTSTWLGLTDHVMQHGRSLSGLAPSTYQQVLTDYLSGGTPLGGLMTLGLGAKLTGEDVAWLFQPTIALYGAMLALVLYAMSGRLITSRPLRAFVAFVGAQPALLFAYALWSGIKEVATAPTIALVAALTAATWGKWTSIAGALPVAVAVAALLAILSPAGAVWVIVPGLIVVLLLLRQGRASFLRSTGGLVGWVAVLSIPSIAIAHTFLSGSAGNELTSSKEVANLGHPLDTLQVFGIWPTTDFRSGPRDRLVTSVLIAVVIAAAVFALLVALRRGAWALPLYVVAAVSGLGIVTLLQHVGLGSPWLSAKAMAEASPALVAAAALAAALLFETGRRTEAVVIGAAIAAGVLWSNGLAYSGVWLAPRGQVAELQTIGSRFAGQGPALMTEPEPYGVRHFLRQMDPEGAAERRRHLVPLLNGQPLAKGTYADLDQFQLNGILFYKTLVLRRSPSESRPPSVYALVWQGRYYDVWQRPDSTPTIREHLPLGDAIQPGAVPRCGDVLRLAQVAGPTGRLEAAPRSPIVEVSLGSASYPSNWNVDSGGRLTPSGAGTIETDVSTPAAGTYSLWLGGLFRDDLRVSVDGRVLVDTSQHLNGLYIPLGAMNLTAGVHHVVLRYGGPGLSPGSGGGQFAIGPLLLSRDAEDPPVLSVAPADARTLCGKTLDWVEALAS